MEASKQLVIHTNGDTSYIDILPTQNLSDAREIILQEFDAEQYPSANNEFTFKVDGLRVSRAQEKKNYVADIIANGKRIELVPSLERAPVAFFTPPSLSSASFNVPTNPSVHTNVEQEIFGSEPFASVDPSKLTISEKKSFKPIGCRAQKTSGQQSIFNVPTPTKPPQVQKVQHDGMYDGILPQKRAAASIYTNSDLREAKNSVTSDASKCGVRVKLEDYSDSTICAQKPSHTSAWSSDGVKSSNGTSSNIRKLELKKTVEVMDLCGSSDDDSTAAVADPVSVSTTVKDFTSMNGAERKMYWSDKKNLANFFKRTLANLTGAECEVCAETGVDKRCNSCGRFYHGVCVDESCHIVCLGCQTSDPQCHLCNQKGGIIVKSFAKPVSMKRWKEKKVEYEKSLFGKDNYCHVICGIFNPSTSLESSDDDRDHTTMNCSELVMSDGKSHIFGWKRCQLCGMKNGAKVKCDECNDMFHVSCARQAGFEVTDGHPLRCFKHVRCQFVLRGRLEDMLYVEKARWSDESFKPDAPMHWNHAASLMHFATDILRTIGWAWRWADWWVAEGDNWEPFLMDGQVEEEMTDFELKRIKSTPGSRALDARRCRLEDVGAALRNRSYDGVGKKSLEQALSNVLSIPSLVGPLNEEEKEFFTTWLSLAYQSKSHKLGIGQDKIPVSNSGFCTRNDGSPKHILGKRSEEVEQCPFQASRRTRYTAR